MIKFRVWMPIHKEYTCKTCGADKEHLAKGFQYIPEDLPLTRELIEDYPNIQQATGLVDKSGKDIFEGDIIQNSNAIYTIIFSRKHARFMAKTGIDTYNLSPRYCMEIIGNIFENPYLETVS